MELYKIYKPLRDRCHSLVREGSSSPFRKLQNRIPPATVIRKLRYTLDKDLCIWRKKATDEARLYEEAYRVLTRFRKDFANAMRDDVRDKCKNLYSPPPVDWFLSRSIADYGKGLLRCENTELSRINQVRQQYRDQYFLRKCIRAFSCTNSKLPYQHVAKEMSLQLFFGPQSGMLLTVDHDALLMWALPKVLHWL